jgi:hypothetical protein
VRERKAEKNRELRMREKKSREKPRSENVRERKAEKNREVRMRENEKPRKTAK